jgi:hypothetical protein
LIFDFKGGLVYLGNVGWFKRNTPLFFLATFSVIKDITPTKGAIVSSLVTELLRRYFQRLLRAGSEVCQSDTGSTVKIAFQIRTGSQLPVLVDTPKACAISGM